MANTHKQDDCDSQRRIWQHGSRLLVVGLVAIALWRDVVFLSASPYPYGIDGYYYLALAEGSDWTLSGRTVPIFPTIVLRSLALLLSPTVAIKVTGLACLYATGLLAFLMVRRLCGNTILAALSCFLIVKGFLRAELLVNFPKQSMGQLCVLLVAYCLVVWRPAKEWRRWPCVALLLVVAALTHSVALALSILPILSWVTIRAFAFWNVPRYRTVAFGMAFALVWAAVFAASQLYRVSERWEAMLYLSTSSTPRFTLPLLYDGLSPSTQYFPATFFETLLLCGALVGVAVLGWRIGGKLGKPSFDRLWRAAMIFVPQAALVFCPFLVPAHLDRVGLHFRLVGSLGLAAALLVPIVIHVYFPRRRTWIAVVLLMLLAVPPHAWPTSVLPPIDEGALHRAMIDVADEIPRDAVIITSQAIGNMVTALWHRPREVATRFDLPLTEENYYRLSVFPGPLKDQLGAFVTAQNSEKSVHTLVGSWVLIEEVTYRAFRDHLWKTAPELAEKLVA